MTPPAASSRISRGRLSYDVPAQEPMRFQPAKCLRLADRMQINLQRTLQNCGDSFRHPSFSTRRIAPKENLRLGIKPGFEETISYQLLPSTLRRKAYNYVVHLVREHGV